MCTVLGRVWAHGGPVAPPPHLHLGSQTRHRVKSKPKAALEAASSSSAVYQRGTQCVPPQQAFRRGRDSAVARSLPLPLPLLLLARCRCRCRCRCCASREMYCAISCSHAHSWSAICCSILAAKRGASPPLSWIPQLQVRVHACSSAAGRCVKTDAGQHPCE